MMGSPMTGRYSTSDQKNDAFIETSQFMANVWSKLKK